MDLTRPIAPNPYELLPATPTFELRSDDLEDGQPIPALHTAAGGNVSPTSRGPASRTGRRPSR